MKSKDRITLPKEARNKLNVSKGDHVVFMEDGKSGLRIMKAKLQLDD